MRRRPALAAVAAIAVAVLTLTSVGAETPPAFEDETLAVQEFGGEPSIAIDPRTSPARIYVVEPSLDHTLLFRSDDGGATFRRMAASRGESGDSDVAVDADGVLYVSDLFERLPVSVSFDGGESFARVTRPGISGVAYDRQWLVARGRGHVVVTARNLNSGSLQAFVSVDAALSFTGPYNVASSVQVGGPMAFAPDGTLWTVYLASRTIRVASSIDGGRKWTTRSVAPVGTSAVAAPLFPTLIFPSLAVDDGGRIYTSWAAAPVATVPASFPAAVFVATSGDRGATWSSPAIVSDPGRTAIFPWIVGGAAGKANLVSYRASDALPSDAGSPVTTWDVVLSQTFDGGRTWSTSTVAPRVHTGSICSIGTLCLGPQWLLGYGNAPGPFDRRPLDFFEVDVLPDGRAVVAYPADHDALTGDARDLISANQDLRAAVQNGGSVIR